MKQFISRIIGLALLFTTSQIVLGQYTSPVSSTPLIISWPLTEAYPGIEYNIRLGVIGGKYPYTFSLTQSPSGMTIDPDTGEITWTPGGGLDGDSFGVTTKVTDSLSQEVTQSYTLNVTGSGFYFISGSGNDTTGDGSISSPWRSIEFAVDQGSTNDYLYLRAGTYTGRVEMDPGNINKWIAYPGDAVPIIDLDLSGIHFEDDYSYFDGFEIINANRWGFGAGNASYSVFRRLHMHHLYDNSDAENPCFIWFAASSVSRDIVIQDSVFHDLFDRGLPGDPDDNYHGAAVTLYDTANVLFEDNEVYRIDGRGFNDKRRGTGTTVRENTFTHPSGDGFHFQAVAFGGATNGEILYNVMTKKIVDDALQRVVLHPGGGNYVHHNTIIGTVDSWDSEFVDNIVVSDPDMRIGRDCSDNTNPDPIDHNVYWSTETYFCGLPWETRDTFEEHQARGYDANTITDQAPQFVDAANNDYTPVEGSFVCTEGREGTGVGALPCEGEVVIDSRRGSGINVGENVGENVGVQLHENPAEAILP